MKVYPTVIAVDEKTYYRQDDTTFSVYSLVIGDGSMEAVPGGAEGVVRPRVVGMLIVNAETARDFKQWLETLNRVA